MLQRRSMLTRCPVATTWQPLHGRSSRRTPSRRSLTGCASPPGKWSAGEVLHHLLLAENLYRGNFAQLIELQKSGQRPILRRSFADLNTSIAHIPKPILPMLEIPFTVMNMFVPSVVRETMMQFRLVPAQNPDVITPKKGQPVNDLRVALQASYDEMAALFNANPNLNYRGMTYQHPIIGSNNEL